MDRPFEDYASIVAQAPGEPPLCTFHRQQRDVGVGQPPSSRVQWSAEPGSVGQPGTLGAPHSGDYQISVSFPDGATGLDGKVWQKGSARVDAQNAPGVRGLKSGTWEEAQAQVQGIANALLANTFNVLLPSGRCAEIKLMFTETYTVLGFRGKKYTEYKTVCMPKHAEPPPAPSPPAPPPARYGRITPTRTAVVTPPPRGPATRMPTRNAIATLYGVPEDSVLGFSVQMLPPEE